MNSLTSNGNFYILVKTLSENAFRKRFHKVWLFLEGGESLTNIFSLIFVSSLNQKKRR